MANRSMWKLTHVSIALIETSDSYKTWFWTKSKALQRPKLIIWASGTMLLHHWGVIVLENINPQCLHDKCSQKKHDTIAYHGLIYMNRGTLQKKEQPTCSKQNSAMFTGGEHTNPCRRIINHNSITRDMKHIYHSQCTSFSWFRKRIAR